MIELLNGVMEAFTPAGLISLGFVIYWLKFFPSQYIALLIGLPVGFHPIIRFLMLFSGWYCTLTAFIGVAIIIRFIIT